MSLLQSIEFEDITSIIKNLSLNLKENDLLQFSKFSLYDSMSATELADKRMDSKFDYKLGDSLQKLIQQEKVKPPSLLNTQDLVNLFDQLLSRFLTFNNGYCFSETYLQFVYLYDPSYIQQENKILSVILDGFNFLSFTYMDLIRSSNIIRDEDQIFSYALSINAIDYKVDQLSFQIVMQKLKELEQTVSQNTSFTNIKSIKIQNYAFTPTDALYQRIKFLKSFCHIYAIVNKRQLTIENHKEIQQLGVDIMQQIEVLKVTQTDDLMLNYFSETIQKSLLVLIQVRKTPQFIDNKQIYTNIEQIVSVNKLISIFKLYKLDIIVNQFSYTSRFTLLLFLMQHFKIAYEISQERSLIDIFDKLDEFTKVKRSNIIKIYMEASMFAEENKFFGQVQYSTLVLDYIEKYGFSVKKYIENEKFDDFIKKITYIVIELLIKSSKNRLRQRRDFDKQYTDLSLMIHEANQFEDELMKKKSENMLLITFCYDFSLQFLIKQLFQGFELELYQQQDFPQIFFHLDYLCQVFENNSKNFLKNIDQEFIIAWQQKLNLTKKKKKTTDFQRQFFFRSIQNKAMQMYLKAMSILSYFLLQKNLIINYNDEQTDEHRYNNRLKIFEGVYFLKKLDYQYYKKTMDGYFKDNDDNDLLQQLKTIFKNSSNIFTTLVDEPDLPEKKKQEIKLQIRINVLNGLAITKYEMYIKKLVSDPQLKASVNILNKEHIFYPVIDIKF